MSLGISLTDHLEPTTVSLVQPPVPRLFAGLRSGACGMGYRYIDAVLTSSFCGERCLSGPCHVLAQARRLPERLRRPGGQGKEGIGRLVHFFQ